METQKIPYKSLLFVCTHSREDGRVSCANPGRPGARLRDALKDQVAAQGLKGRVRVCASGCMDLCAQGPNVMVFTEKGEQIWYKNVSEADIPEILSKHF